MQHRPSKRQTLLLYTSWAAQALASQCCLEGQGTPRAADALAMTNEGSEGATSLLLPLLSLQWAVLCHTGNAEMPSKEQYAW